ncbi:hypothetical protein NIE88_20045 [Sporolactobacillus shoreicorticis]|uniref:Uncharacterized protein n=1 Tax=Sporolactobacillus shoreicorticis TaxID=1923877 RepID=A0ABW5S073_9BACL|nr:hypothetical protein [Sporolactobacillus shoreicorticis]MCO7128038.1 hypothetical protein [Sporolactobacillus shoreicorticis]
MNKQFAVIGLGQLGSSVSIELSVFHAVSAFNNAGFALFPDNLIRYVGDLVINLTISSPSQEDLVLRFLLNCF